MEDQSYGNASSDVKASIIAQAEPQEARRLCQLNRQSREICQGRLPQQVKFRSCLDNATAAQECDLIPIFSKQQFLSLIPQHIEIFPEDSVQMTFEFYSQNYKLPTEGFSIALLKAKLMNTICAMMRPEFLISSAARNLKIPPYIDPRVLDVTAKEYITALSSPPTSRYSSLSIHLHNKKLNKYSPIILRVNFNNNVETLDIIEADIQFILNDLNLLKEMQRRISTDKFLSRMQSVNGNNLEELGISFLSLLDINGHVNMFYVSRLLKIAFDLDYFHDPTAELIFKNQPLIDLSL